MRGHIVKSLSLLSFFSVLYIIEEVKCSIKYPPTVLGTCDFRQVRASRWFVDKTMMLNELVQSEMFVYLLTYPRRWGKTINLSMVSLYFDLYEASQNKILFEGTNITKCSNCERVQALQGTTPVIFLDFKGIKQSHTEWEFLNFMKPVIAEAYATHAYLKGTIEKKYGVNSENVNKFNDYCSRSLTEYILRKKEKHDLDTQIKEMVDQIQNVTREIRKEERPYRDQQAKAVGEVMGLKNITLKEKGEQVKEILRIFKPFFNKAARAEKRALREFEKRSRSLRNSLDEINKSELRRLSDHVCESVEFLARMLYEATGRKSIVLIDEYDTPINKALPTSLRHILPVLASFMEKTFKSVSRIAGESPKYFVVFGLITGILRVAKASLFSKVNNFSEHNMLSSRLFSYYGFTQHEVGALMKKFREKHPKGTLTEDDLKYWYDGFKMGDNVTQEFYCPWPIINALEYGKPGDYFTKSGSLSEVSGVVKSLMMLPTILSLIGGGTVPMPKDSLLFEETDLESLQFLAEKSKQFTEKDEELALKLLFTAGYLTIDATENNLPISGLKAANEEVRRELFAILHSYHTDDLGISKKKMDDASDAFNYVFVSKDVTDLQMRYQEMLEAYPAFTKNRNGKGLFYNEHNCQTVMEMVATNLLLRDKSGSHFESGELTYRRKTGDYRRSDIVYYRKDIKTAVVFEMRTKGSAFKALKDAEDKYSEYLDGFNGIQRKIFIGVYVEINKKVQMETVTRDVPKSKKPGLFSTSRPK